MTRTPYVGIYFEVDQREKSFDGQAMRQFNRPYRRHSLPVFFGNVRNDTSVVRGE